MKKTFFLLAACLVCSLAAMAQTTKVVTGAVIDEYGNPLPGATVAVPKGANSAVVDADGTYSIELPVWSNTLVATYAGMWDKKMKIAGSEVIFRMKPQKGQWFINAIGEYDFYGGGPFVGLMGGYLGKWGGYLKVTLNLVEDLPAVTAGVTKRLCDWLHLYLGVGAAPYIYICDWCGTTHDDGYRFAMDFGFMIKPIKHFNINVGTFAGEDIMGIQVGLGYSF